MRNHSNNRGIPQARQGMEPFKMRSRQEVGINLHGHLTSRKAGGLGKQMVKKICPVRSAKFDRTNQIAMGHIQAVKYIAAITI